MTFLSAVTPGCLVIILTPPNINSVTQISHLVCIRLVGDITDDGEFLWVYRCHTSAGLAGQTIILKVQSLELRGVRAIPYIA